MKTTESRLFHYTIGAWLPMIMESGIIDLATAGVPDNVRPAAWFTMRGDWEPICNKLAVVDGRFVVLSRRETELRGSGLFRIEINPSYAQHTWADYRRLSGESRAGIRNLEKLARKNNGNLAQWRCSFEPVPKMGWRSIEMRQGDGRWIDLGEIATELGLIA